MNKMPCSKKNVAFILKYLEMLDLFAHSKILSKFYDSDTYIISFVSDPKNDAEDILDDIAHDVSWNFEVLKSEKLLDSELFKTICLFSQPLHKEIPNDSDN
jgi:hypothetical protein